MMELHKPPAKPFVIKPFFMLRLRLSIPARSASCSRQDWGAGGPTGFAGGFFRLRLLNDGDWSYFEAFDCVRFC
jgi:hypothetical protein